MELQPCITTKPFTVNVIFHTGNNFTLAVLSQGEERKKKKGKKDNNKKKALKHPFSS